MRILSRFCLLLSLLVFGPHLHAGEAPEEPESSSLLTILVSCLQSGACGQKEPPAPPVDPEGPLQVSANSHSSSAATCVVYGDGGLKCWGANPGDGSSSASSPVVVPGITAASHVAVGEGHACVVDGGQVKCWGSGANGQLGNGAQTSSSTPVAVAGITQASFVAAGNGFTCAIVRDGDDDDVRCWGNSIANGSIDPDTGNGDDALVPIDVSLPHDAIWLSAGKARDLACAVLKKPDATMETWCWGNTYSEMEVDDAQCSFNLCAPTLAAGLGPPSGIVEVGRGHACYQTENGEAVCKGSAQGDTFSVLAPPVNFVAFAAGENFTCGIDGDGNAKCWGWNGEYQLGDGTNDTTRPFTTAINVLGVTNATSISAGFLHACAIDAGAVKCWGSVSGGFAPFIVGGF